MGDPASLRPPQAYLFHGRVLAGAYALNRFAFDFKYAATREAFAQDPEQLMSDYKLSVQEKALLRARNWTGLVAHGGHHFNIIKIAAALGLSHLHVGAHMAGAQWESFKASLPHDSQRMPGDLD